MKYKQRDFRCPYCGHDKFEQGMATTHDIFIPEGKGMFAGLRGRKLANLACKKCDFVIQFAHKDESE